MYNFLKFSFFIGDILLFQIFINGRIICMYVYIYIYIYYWLEGTFCEDEIIYEIMFYFFSLNVNKEFDLGLNLTIGIDTCPLKKIMGWLLSNNWVQIVKPSNQLNSIIRYPLEHGSQLACSMITFCRTSHWYNDGKCEHNIKHINAFIQKKNI